jgi:lysophospholipase L1-like esterase
MMIMSKLTRRGLIAAVCAAPLAGHASALLAQDADSLPAVFFIGDSIIRNGYYDDGETNGQWGWGHMMKWRFDTSRIHVVNDAMGGTSSRSFMESPTLWPKVKQMIRPGDFVLMGFGHNDGPSTLHGNGDETGFLPPRPPRPPRAGETPRPAPAPVAVHSFGWYMRQYIKEVRALGATPIVMSLIPRNRWTDGKIGDAGKDYAVWAKEAADQEHAQFIPLNDMVTDALNKIGQEEVQADYFPKGEGVHPNWKGAVLISGLVADGVRKLDTPLKQYLVASPKLPKTPDIAAPTLGDMGPSDMKPKARTPKAI